MSCCRKMQTSPPPPSLSFLLPAITEPCKPPPAQLVLDVRSQLGKAHVWGTDRAVTPPGHPVLPGTPTCCSSVLWFRSSTGVKDHSEIASCTDPELPLQGDVFGKNAPTTALKLVKSQAREAARCPDAATMLAFPHCSLTLGTAAQAGDLPGLHASPTAMVTCWATVNQGATRRRKSQVPTSI